jgi:hypothetical protein
MWLLVAVGLGCAVVAWLARGLDVAGRLDAAYWEGVRAANEAELAGLDYGAVPDPLGAEAETEHDAAWEAMVTGAPLAGLESDEPALEGTVGRRDGDGIVVPRLVFPPEPWTILDAEPATSERLATVAEVRADADYWLWRTEMAGLIDGAAQWFDEEFHTGTFRAAGR